MSQALSDFAPIPEPTLREQVLTWLEDQVPPKRLQHILGVEQFAADLAQQHHLDAEAAAQAGLMHDLAKCFKPKKLLQMAQVEGLEIDPVAIQTPHLLHADVGAIVARDEFGVESTVILDAIANHTLGRPGMDPLSCVVFLADALEPGRGDTDDLNHLRQLSQTDLTAAVAQTCDASIRYLLDRQALIHPRTVLTRNWFWQACHEQT